jgi:broad specificity phosphatase PhoE
MTLAIAARSVYFVTHPNVVISRDVPVPQWPLSELGRARMTRGLTQPWLRGVTSIYSSTERKAIDGAQIIADHLRLSFTPIPELGENDRSSTGFLPPDEFEAVANEFFARPMISVRGWERAVDAQSRVVSVVARLIAADETTGSIAIVAHGAVGALLFCQLSGTAIDRRHDQPANGGGNYFHFSLEPCVVQSGWLPIDQPVVASHH